jgi:F420H(2)-dependent quinone reductase
MARPSTQSKRVRGDRERQGFDVSSPLDWNAKTIAEFRGSEGKVGGVFEGAPLVLVHHRGRKSGREYVSPVMYFPHGADHNLTAAGDGSVERGTETYELTVHELARIPQAGQHGLFIRRAAVRAAPLSDPPKETAHEGARPRPGSRSGF